MGEKRRSDSGVRAVKRKKEGGITFKPLAWFTALCLVVYAAVTIVSQQVQIAQLKQEKDDINEQISQAKQLNDEYSRQLSSEDESEYMERIVVEDLGYAYPNERRFYVVETQ
ncbi:MAG: septum formation initiator family protein [Ruminococcus sp.]|nr:septum formation initiator family protein [Ruminococcus sp.]